MKTEEIGNTLANSEVFGQFSEQERNELAKLATQRSLKKGERLCLQGDYWPFVFYIASGVLRSIIGTPDGRNYVVYHWQEGEEFWSHSLLDGDPMPSTLEAHEDTVIYRWPGETVFSFLLRNPDAVRALLKRQTRLIRKRRENIYNLAFNPVASRLAKLIVEKYRDAESPTVQRDLTLEEMAAMVASSPEVVCRILYQFQDDGFINVDRATITLRDHGGLENLVIHD
jgi:CRP/FNR family transcriptional regulator